MSRALRRSGLPAVARRGTRRVWKITRASVYRSLKQTPPTTVTCRPGPVGACSDGNWQIISAGKWSFPPSQKGYRKLWARLRFAGVRASPRRVHG